MLKPYSNCTERPVGLITVQDNTMLKQYILRKLYLVCLITVQDNTMLKLLEFGKSLAQGLITVQDNTMLKLWLRLGYLE